MEYALEQIALMIKIVILIKMISSVFKCIDVIMSFVLTKVFNKYNFIPSVLLKVVLLQLIIVSFIFKLATNFYPDSYVQVSGMKNNTLNYVNSVQNKIFNTRFVINYHTFKFSINL